MDIRLQTKSMELDGKEFKLCCNFNVLADVEALHGGLETLLRSKSPMNTARVFLSCMMNDYADSMGWPERYTPRQAGRFMSTEPKKLNGQVSEIMELIIGAVRAEPAAEQPSSEDTGKN